MMILLRIAVIVFGAGFLLLGLVSSVGPGFPIAHGPPRPASELYLQAALIVAYGAALVFAGAGPLFRPLVKRCLIAVLLLAPILLWFMSWGADSVTRVVNPFVIFYAAVTISGIAVLARRPAE